MLPTSLAVPFMYSPSILFLPKKCFTISTTVGVGQTVMEQVTASGGMKCVTNDYAIAEHIRIAKTLEEFKEQSHLTEVWSGSLKTQLYTRWMIIGRKN